MKHLVIIQSEDIISAVLKEIDTGHKDLSKNLVVFPGKRPSYFLLNALSRKMETSFIPPVIFSIDEFIDYCYEHELGIIDKKIDALSCCKTLKDLITKDLIKPHLQDLNAFLPFGLKLYSALEELLIEGISAERLKIDDVVLDDKIAAADRNVIIKRTTRLSEIYKLFYEIIQKKAFSTRSLRYKRVSEGDIKLSGFETIIFAGFFALTMSEKEILTKLTNDNRSMFIFQDETSKSYILDNTYTPPPLPIDNITLYECPDSHSQVFKLAEILRHDYEAKKDGETFAIIAPSPDIIMPLINTIDKEFDTYNISIGYPLKKTPLYTFIKCLFDVLISIKKDEVYIPDYLNFVLHPYTKNITLNQSAEITRTAFHSIENALSKNRFKNYIKLKDIVGCLKNEDASIIDHINTIHKNTIEALSGLRNIKDLAGRLKTLIDYIYTHSTAKRHILFFPYCEYMLHALTELENSLIAEESFNSPQQYFDFFKRFISLYNVPFKGTPIKDIQVLGFLEARNLKFDNLYILDVNEGILPNTNREDTLLPYDVRVRLGLPTYRDKDRLFDYYLRCALNSAKKSVIFYVEDNQRERSRFVEQIIWERQKKDMDTKKESFTPLSYSFTLKPNKPQGVSKTEEIKEYLKNLTYSASSLDTYFQCPLMFYYRYVLLPAEEEGVYEELEGKDIGIIVHEILKTYFDNKCASYNEQRFKQTVDEVFKKHFGSDLKGEILIIKYQIRKRISEFIINYTKITKANSIEILELEKEFKATIKINSIENINLKGKIDRLERRDNDEIFIVDYKTSSDSRQYKAWWDKFDINNRTTWKDAIKSMQMIFYMYLLVNDINCTYKPTNASIMLLRQEDTNKAEVRLFDDNNGNYKTHIPAIITTLITEIISQPTFTPTDDINDCDRCDYKDICWR